MNDFVFKGEVREEEETRAPRLQEHYAVEKRGYSQKLQGGKTAGEKLFASLPVPPGSL